MRNEQGQNVKFHLATTKSIATFKQTSSKFKVGLIRRQIKDKSCLICSAISFLGALPILYDESIIERDA